MATPIPTNRAPFTLDEIAIASAGRITQPTARELRGVLTDSRAVTPGSIFVALRGASDGHSFVPAAIAAGAGAVVVERDIEAPDGVGVVVVRDTLHALGDMAAAHRQRFSIPVIGITGSVGKTTTKELTAAALSAVGVQVLRSEGNLNNLIGVPATLFCLERSHEVAVIEMGMNTPGEIARLTEIARPTVGVVTAVAAAHLAGVGSLGAIAREKGALLTGLGPAGVAVWNADDELITPYGTASKAATKLRFGTGDGNDVRLLSWEIEVDRTRCEGTVRGLREPLTFEVGLLGEGPARSAAAALAAVLATLGPASIEGATRGLASVPASPGRARPIPGLRGSVLLDDSYNSSPRAAILALRTAADLARKTGGRAIAVLGDMLELGGESESLHEEVGAAAVSAGVAVLLCYGSEMRAAARGALSAATGSGVFGVRIESVDRIEDAIEIVRGVVEPGDVVLVKGSRGMRMEQIVDALAGADTLPGTPAPDDRTLEDSSGPGGEQGS